MSWEDDPKISTGEDTSIVDEDEGITLTYVSDVIFTTDEDRLILPLDDYVSLTQNSEKLVEEIEQATRLFKKKHRQLTK
ncbi:MAG: hypothetical protein FK730_10960 [Asgard group archaeon]|nr:hypothetical protein [Asgard group archaeon]